jgi:hypothetical protein
VRRERALVPEFELAPVEVPVDCGRDDDSVDDSACEESFLGRSSGQLQLPGVLYPEEYDIMWLIGCC